MPFDFSAMHSGKVNHDYQMLHRQCHMRGCVDKRILVIIGFKLFKLLKCRKHEYVSCKTKAQYSLTACCGSF